jgi:hypothetical protein
MTRQDASMDFENRASQQHQWPSQFRAIPTAGDVLASRLTARADTYDISIVPDAAHVTARRYPEAMEKVRELAGASKSMGGSLLITRTIRESRLTALVTARPMIPSHLLPPPPPHTHGVSNGATD